MKRLLHLINEVRLGWLVATLMITVFLYGVGYWMLAEQGSIVFTFEGASHPTFFDCLYFSVVTISSLGYGDMRPIGWARALVGLEVVTGLAYFGLLVAKISSVKQDYILRRMYSDVIDDKLAKLQRQLDDQRALYRNTSQLLLSGAMDPELTTTFRRTTPGATLFTQLAQLLSDLCDVIVTEAGNKALFGEVPDSRLEAVYDSVRAVLRRTVLVWDANEEAACELILCDNGPDIERICDQAEALARLARRESRNQRMLETSTAILQLSGQIRNAVLPKL